MIQLIREVSSYLSPAGADFTARIYARLRPDRIWEAWLVFVGADGDPILATGVETTQSSRDAVIHWAGTIGRVYLDGALDRARRVGHRTEARAPATETVETAVLVPPAHAAGWYSLN